MFKLGDTTQSSIIRMNFTKTRGLLPTMTQKVSLRPKGITTIFRLKVYKSVMISLVEIYEKVETSGI